MVQAVTIYTSFLQHRRFKFSVGTSRKVAAGLVTVAGKEPAGYLFFIFLTITCSLQVACLAGISMFLKRVKVLQGAADVVQHLQCSPQRRRDIL